jgi:hypothetical protein
MSFGAIGSDSYCVTPTIGTSGMRMASKRPTKNETHRFAASMNQRGRGKV